MYVIVDAVAELFIRFATMTLADSAQ